MTERRHSWPADHWGWPVKLTHRHGVRVGDMIFTGGQVDLDPSGRVQNPGDLGRQCESAMRYLTRVLRDLDADLKDLARLVVYFIGDATAETRLAHQIARLIGPEARPVLNMIGLPQLCYPQMMVEVEGVALTRPKTSLHLTNGPALPAAFSHIVVSEDLVFTGDISALGPDGAVAYPDDLLSQTGVMMDALGDALAHAGVGYRDVLKLNSYYTGTGTAQNWEAPARMRAGYFPNPGPAPTGMPVPRFPHAEMCAKIAVTASTTPIAHLWPPDHWNWTTPLPYSHGTKAGQLIHVGEQVSLDSQARVIDPGEMVPQTRRAMRNVTRVLEDSGATIDDVVKVTTFYQGSASAKALHDNLLIRSECYRDPGPATTGIPMPALVYEDMLIEIEVIAIAPERELR
ncbi:MAG: RidA family protein [Pseudomonadota bacterium]